MKKNTLLVIFISIAHFLLLFFLGEHCFIWLDESFSLFTSGLSFKDTIHRAIIFEGQPPVYFMLLNLWRNISTTYSFARIFSIMCTTISIPLFNKIIGSVVEKRKGIYTVLYAINPILIWAGLEIRVYALTILLTLILIIFFQIIFLAERDNIFHKTLFVILSILSVHTTYYLSYVLIGFSLFLFLYNRKKILVYIQLMLIPVISLIIYRNNLFSQINMHITNETGSNIFFFWLNTIRSFFLPIYSTSNFSSLIIGILAFFSLILALILLISKLPIKLSSFEKLICTNIVFLLIAFSFTRIIIGYSSVEARHAIILFPLLFINLIWLIEHTNNKLSIYIVIPFLLLFYILNIKNNPPYLDKEYLLVKIDNYLHEKNRNNHPILFYRGEVRNIYYYLNTDTNIYSFPMTIPLDIPYNHKDWFIKNKEQVENRFNQFNYSDTLWFVDNSLQTEARKYLEKKFGTKLNYDVLNGFISENYYELSDTSFGKKYRVRELIKTTN
ncbi:hypothetical protein ACE01N_02535 [Saccharicrinis sp. FJH2]|uniref:hypothetical protein n=1 Tax=Saccharicrinis sp. FJH65 TaxID=3344659 RepID=UPI0035F3E714